MSTNPLERIPKRSPQTSVTNLNEFAETAGSTAASAAYPIMLGLTGEDTGDEWYKDLAYSAVPGGALVQRAKTGTIPGLLDLLPGDVGAGARLAMVPIAAAFSRDLLKGGKARLGKSGKNVSKAMDKKNNPTVVRYHRTHDDNVADIRKQGLVPNSKNQGRNTGDQYMIPDVVWLGNNPTEIPVLRNLLVQRPEDVAEFKVKIPSDVYYNTPRYKFPNGRGAGKPELVPSGKPSLSDEGDYKIDMFGGTIPPEMLERIPTVDLQYMLARDNKANELAWMLMNPEPNSAEGLVRNRLRHENPALGERVDRAVEEVQAGSGRLIDRDALERANANLPMSMRFSSNSNEYEKTLKKASSKISNAMKADKYGQQVFFYTPHQRLKDALDQLPLDEQGRVVTKKYYPPETKLSDLVKEDPDYIPTPEELGGFTKTMPGPEQIAKGSVSFGGADRDWVRPIKERHFDVGKFEEHLAAGYSPGEAARVAFPKVWLKKDPTDPTGQRWSWQTEYSGVRNPNYGMISEGLHGHYYDMNRLQRLMSDARSYGLKGHPELAKELHDAFSEVLRRPVNISPKRLSEFTPGSRLPDWDLRR